MGLIQDVEKLKEDSFKDKVVEKKFRYPLFKKVGKGQRKKNYVTILIINENSTCDWKKYQIEDQTVMHDMIPRLASAGHVIKDKKGNPLIILPSWSVEPFSPLDHYQKTLVDGSNQVGYRLLLNRMETEKVVSKKKMGKILPWILGLGLAGVILFAVISGGGG